MSSQLPRPFNIAGYASGRAVVRGKLSIASQRQRERAKLLAHVDKSREPTIDTEILDDVSVEMIPLRYR
jgi:hypothetical protein